MDWHLEIKALNKAIKQSKIEKTRLEESLRNCSNGEFLSLSRLVVKKELAIDNLDKRLELAKQKICEDTKKLNID